MRAGSLGFPGNMALLDEVEWEGVWGGEALPRSTPGIQ